MKGVHYLKAHGLSEKFQADVSWNLAGFGMAGLSGILAAFLVARFYGAAALGVFNQVYALYVLFSQFSAFGFHLSLCRHLSASPDDKSRVQVLIGSALPLAAAVALVFCLLLFLCTGMIGRVLRSPDVKTGILWVIPGLWFFSLNKMLLAVLNGLRRMRAYALAQIGRGILLITALIFLMAANMPAATLAGAFSVSEGILFAVLCVLIFCDYRPFHVPVSLAWMEEHAVFGLKGFGSGALGELNTRVDVLMLGIFLPDAVIGIYSVAGMLSDGFFQILGILRTVLNPMLTPLLGVGREEDLRRIVRRGKLLTYQASALCGVLACAIFPLVIPRLLPAGNFLGAWPAFALLMAGNVLASGYVPFTMMLVQAGHPGHYTLLVAAGVAINISLNAVFIPLWGINGAALATALSAVSSVFIFKAFIRKLLRVSL